MAETNSRTKFESRVTELLARGLTQRQALRVAKRERRLVHPLHARAAVRRWQMAQDRRASVEVQR